MTQEVYAGVDVSKDWLDADWGKQQRYENSPRGIKRLVARLSKGGVSLVVVESTGGYERKLVEALLVAEVPVAVVNPLRTKSFATSLGIRAKTDPIDAGVLRLFAERMKPRPQKLPPKRVQKLRHLLDRRAQLMNIIVAEKNRKKAPLGSPETQRSIQRTLKVLQREVKKIEASVQEVIESNEDLKLIADTVQKEKGVGPVLTLALLAEMPELGTLNRSQVASLTGVAPFNNQSGNSDKRRTIRGGRKRFRHTLYMATVCAIRRNQRLKDFFLSLVKRGKNKMTALIATMRKFIIRLNSIVRNLRENNSAIDFAYA